MIFFKKSLNRLSLDFNKACMKKIINGRKYDTDTAKAIASYSNDRPCSDFRYFYETLYQKHTKEFFLYGEGGPLSKYAEHCGQGWIGAEGIIPLTLDDAKEWVENHCNAEKYEKLFGEVAE